MKTKENVCNAHGNYNTLDSCFVRSTKLRATAQCAAAWRERDRRACFWPWCRPRRTKGKTRTSHIGHADKVWKRETKWNGIPTEIRTTTNAPRAPITHKRGRSIHWQISRVAQVARQRLYIYLTYNHRTRSVHLCAWSWTIRYVEDSLWWLIVRCVPFYVCFVLLVLFVVVVVGYTRPPKLSYTIHFSLDVFSRRVNVLELTVGNPLTWAHV